MGKQIAVLMTDLFEESEFTEPKKALTEAGHNVVVIEKEKGKMLKGKNGNDQFPSMLRLTMSNLLNSMRCSFLVAFLPIFYVRMIVS